MLLVDRCHQGVDFVVEILVLGDFRPARRTHLQKHEPFAPLRVALEKPIDGAQALRNALRVVHAIDADGQRPLVSQSVRLAERLNVAAADAVLRDALHVDADRKRADLGFVRGARDRKVLVVDARLDEAIDRVEKIVAMQLHVEAEQIAAEQAVEDLFLPRADAEGLPMRPWNVPEMADDRVWTALLDESRKEREVIVLHEHDRGRALDFLEDGLSELRVDTRILFPVAGVENGARVRDVTQAATARGWRNRSSSLLLLQA